MIEISDLHARKFFELSDTDNKIFLSLVHGILLLKNGGGYIPYSWNGSCFGPNKMVSDLASLDKFLQSRLP